MKQEQWRSKVGVSPFVKIPKGPLASLTGFVCSAAASNLLPIFWQ